MGGVDNNKWHPSACAHHLRSEGRPAHATEDYAGDTTSDKRGAQFRDFSNETQLREWVLHPPQANTRFTDRCWTPQSCVLRK